MRYYNSDCPKNLYVLVLDGRPDINSYVSTYVNAYLRDYKSDCPKFLYIPGWDGRSDININVSTSVNAYLCYSNSECPKFLYVPGWDGHPDININVLPTLMLICATIIVIVLGICMYLDGIVAQISILIF